TAYVVVDPDNETTQARVLEAALRRDRADLGVLAVRDRLSAELRLERERQAQAPQAKDPAQAEEAAAVRRRSDPLARHRGVLGEQRSTRLSEQAAAGAERVRWLPSVQLVAERDAAAPVWERLDRGGAREARLVQRDLAEAQTRAQEALAAAAALEQRAGETTGLRGRGQRRALEQAAGVQRRIAATEQSEVEH